MRDWPWTHTVYFVLHGLVMVMKQHSYAFTNGHLSTVHRERQRLLAKLGEIEQRTTTTAAAAAAARGSPPDDDPPATSSSSSSSPLSTVHLAHRRRPSAPEYCENEEGEKEERRLLREHQQHDPGEGEGEGEGEDEDEATPSGRPVPLDAAQLRLFARLVAREAEALGEELKGGRGTAAARAATAGGDEDEDEDEDEDGPAAAAAAGASRGNNHHRYPRNVTAANFYEYVALPTLVYELRYARAARVDWWYVAEKAAAMAGVILVMAMVSQTFIYPVVVRALAWKEEEEGAGEAGDGHRRPWDVARRFREFPWLLADLIFPFMMEYLVSERASESVGGLWAYIYICVCVCVCVCKMHTRSVCLVVINYAAPSPLSPLLFLSRPRCLESFVVFFHKRVHIFAD